MFERTARRLIALLVLPLAAAAAGEETRNPAGAAPSANADPFTGAERLELSALVRAVLDRNPSLDAAREAWRAAVERVPQATSWADPMVAAGVAPLSIDSDMPFGASVEARQRLPYPGRLRLAGDIARAEAAAAGDGVELVALELAHLAAELYHRLYLLERSREVNSEHVRLLGEIKETATARYAAGLVPQQAPLRAEVELTHLLHRDMDLVTERRVVAAGLNALLHRPPASPLPPAAEPPERAAPTAPAAATGHRGGQGVAAGAVRLQPPLPSRPELAAVAAEIEARRLEVELAELARYPDLDLMTSYSSMFGGDHRWMLGVAVELPVRRARRRAAEAEAAARLAAAESRQQALAAEVRAELETAAAHLVHTAHVLELYRDRLGPASRDQMHAARSGFETGQVDLGTVIDAERNLRDVDLAAIEARVELSRAHTDLERALGRLPGALPGDPPVVDPAQAGAAPTPEPAPGATQGEATRGQIAGEGEPRAPRAEPAPFAAGSAPPALLDSGAAAPDAAGRAAGGPR